MIQIHMVRKKFACVQTSSLVILLPGDTFVIILPWEQSEKVWLNLVVLGKIKMLEILSIC